MLTTDEHVIRLMDGRTPSHELTNFTEFTFYQGDMERGAWTLEAPFAGNEKIFGEWLDMTHPGIQAWTETGDERALGYLAEFSIVETPQGDSLRAGGFDWVGLLDDRLVPPSDGTIDLADYWRYQTHSTTDTDARVARVWVSQVIQALSWGGTASDGRELPFPADLAPLAAGGATSPVYGQALPTLQRVRELLTGSSDTLRMVPNIHATIGNVLAEFVVGPRPEARTPLSVAESTLGQVISTRKAATGTRVIGVGAEIGGGPQREVAEAANWQPENWERRYIERFVNAPTLSGAELVAECQRELAARVPVRSIVATNPRPGLWGSDLGVGWLAEVSVRDHHGRTEYVPLPVVGTTLTINPKGQTRSIEFGSADLRDLDGVFAEIGALQLRLEKTRRSF